MTPTTTHTEIELDVCTPEGKTWLARITGADSHYGLAREFVRAVSRDLSRSGMTGTMTFLVGPGVYERHEGRRRYQHLNGFFVVDETGSVRQLASATEALAELEG